MHICIIICIKGDFMHNSGTRDGSDARFRVRGRGGRGPGKTGRGSGMIDKQRRNGYNKIREFVNRKGSFR